MIAVIQELADLMHAVVKLVPATFSTQPPTDPPSVRIGPGGDIPVAPPVAMVVLIVGGFGVSYATGIKGSMFQFTLPQKYGVPARVVAGLAVASIGTRIKRQSENALALAGTKAAFAPVPSVADTGPFAKCRNPMYWAIMSVPALAGFAADNAWVAVGSNVVLWLYLHFIVVPAEEKFLREQLGDPYKKYCASVKRWGFF